MKRIGLHSLIALLVLASGLWAETQGTFRGEVVRPPRGERAAGMLYLMGPDGNVRRVVFTRAAVVYDAGVPSGDRVPSARRALIPGAQVRVTALIDAKSGEWTASRVEVIAHHAEDADDKDDAAPDEVTAPDESVTSARTI